MKKKLTRCAIWVKRNILLLLCLAALILGGVYLLYNYVYLPQKIENQNDYYARLYQPATDAPEPTAAPSIMPENTATDAPTAAPTADVIIDSRKEDAARDDFEGLLSVNPDTVGFLSVGAMISLPVAQRLDDNAYYLTHDFSGAESDEGTLFLDGANRLDMDDMCLIIYGHNMKNKTMFGRLPNYEIEGVLGKYAITRFDTLYHSRRYVPFAVFAISDNPSRRDYMNVRRIDFTQNEFEEYVLELKSRSLYDIPIDVEYGDRLLMLVTCNYSTDDGRFIVALRELREGEREDELSLLVGQSARK